MGKTIATIGNNIRYEKLSDEIRYIKLNDGTNIPIEYFESEQMLLNYLLNKSVRKAQIEQMLKINCSIKIQQVIFSGPATIVFWRDGSKTVVKCTEGDKMDYEVGIAMCTLKKLLGETYVRYKKDVKHIVELKKKHEKIEEDKNGSNPEEQKA